ncbi:hypothetical protein CNR22_00725 [Sphingobacteriaceae bacterium]|nr:hypothetical protein CNR22_00725 [Sphingobacteriaceae bacterium]
MLKAFINASLAGSYAITAFLRCVFTAGVNKFIADLNTNQTDGFRKFTFKIHQSTSRSCYSPAFKT